MLKKYFFIFLAALLYVADQLSKQIVVRVLPENQSLTVIPGIFSLTRVNNTGAAFGLFRGMGIFLVLVTLVSITTLVLWLFRGGHAMKPFQRWGWVLVTGGALGNLHDRLVYRHVIDFLDFRVWPVFNLADSFVCVGVFLVILSVLRDP